MKYPGEITDPAQLEWFEKSGGQMLVAGGDGKTNPCVNFYGQGPADKKCKHCALCYTHGGGKNYYKCELRVFSCGPATDHRANWPTCGKFKAKPA